MLKLMERNKETAICRLCLEPVTNFICTDCLFADIESWIFSLPRKIRELHVILTGKNRTIKSMLSHEVNRTSCFVCKNQVDEIACPCCYLYEMHTAVKMVDAELAREFETYFNFDFIFHHGIAQLNLWESIHGKMLSSRAFKPILIVDQQKRRDMNICDMCEQTSDDLAEIEGQWLCETCRDEILTTV